MEKSVKVVAITKPLVDGTEMTPNDFIAYCARVSNPGNQNNLKTASKLIKYCAEHGHWSVFQMVTVALEIKTTRDISHQFIRHWSFDNMTDGIPSFQEFSQRYAEVPEEFVIRETRTQDTKNRQNSFPVDNGCELDWWWRKTQQHIIDFAYDAYKEALDRGIAKEVARVILPEGNTLTTFYVSGTLRSWITYCMSRIPLGAQQEHRDLALECWNQLLVHFPDIKSLIQVEEKEDASTHE